MPPRSDRRDSDGRGREATVQRCRGVLLDEQVVQLSEGPASAGELVAGDLRASEAQQTEGAPAGAGVHDPLELDARAGVLAAASGVTTSTVRSWSLSWV
jgi:hypothetical protein